MNDDKQVDQESNYVRPVQKVHVDASESGTTQWKWPVIGMIEPPLWSLKS